MTTRRRGRPALDPTQPLADVHVRLPASLYDEAFAAATRAGVSLPELIRRAVRRTLADVPPRATAPNLGT
jgi:predicted HicB family RNase H-like nuclease